MKILDVFTKEMVDFSFVITPPRVEILALFFTPFFGGGNVSNRSIKPDVPKVLASSARDFKSEVGLGS